jgi:hypothetical protein
MKGDWNLLTPKQQNKVLKTAANNWCDLSVFLDAKDERGLFHKRKNRHGTIIIEYTCNNKRCRSKISAHTGR